MFTGTHRDIHKYTQVHTSIHAEIYTGTHRCTQVHTQIHRYSQVHTSTHTLAHRFLQLVCDTHLHLSLTQGPWFKSSHLWISALVSLFLECWSQVALPCGQHHGPSQQLGSPCGHPPPWPSSLVLVAPGSFRTETQPGRLLSGGGPCGVCDGPREDRGPPLTRRGAGTVAATVEVLSCHFCLGHVWVLGTLTEFILFHPEGLSVGH